MARPQLRLTSVTIHSGNPRALARFYAELLQWPVTVDEPPGPGQAAECGFSQLRPPQGEPGPRLNFEYECDFAPPIWPTVSGGQQVMEHLDIAVEDLDSAQRWALDHGATLADEQPNDDVRVFFDPDGHPFCFFLDQA